MPALRIDCPPKINLYLRIVRRREDGFHELETVFQSVGGGDVLTAEPAGDLSLRCSDAALSTGPANLVSRAAMKLWERFPEAAGRGAALHLEKHTPMGAGMGGGSVDAAATLVLLSALWGISPSADELAAIAAELGSDVPFFLHGGTALGAGRGEKLEPLPTPRLWLVLVRPPVSVDTGSAYGQWRPEACDATTVAEFTEALAVGDPHRIAAHLRNDLEPGVAACYPEIGAAREWLRAQGALGARMTGSGSVVFGIARDEAHAESIAAEPGVPGEAWTVRCLTADEARLRVRDQRL
jgi:4-diphosphocytidyl-2-C-methyl-D-erythritol kinase